METITHGPPSAPIAKSLAAWQFVQQMLADVTQIVTEDAERRTRTARGTAGDRPGHRAVLGTVRRGRSRLPWFFDMCSPPAWSAAPTPTADYLLAMIRGDRRYRVTGTRGTTAYLGLQVLAGTGLTPRRMAGYVSDTDLKLDAGTFTLVFPPHEPTGRSRWRAMAPDPRGRLVDRGPRVHRRSAAERDPRRCASRPSTPTAAADPRRRSWPSSSPRWRGRIMKLTTLHRTIKPELLTSPTRC